jgi:hypothetical protein
MDFYSIQFLKLKIMNEVNANTTLQEEQIPAAQQEQQVLAVSKSAPQDEQTQKKKKQELAHDVAGALGVNIDERKSLLSNIYTNFVQNYHRKPWIKQQNFEKILPALEKLGQTLEKLSEAGVLNNLIDGKVTSKILPIIIVIDGKDIETTGKLVVHQNATDDTNLKMYPIKKEANLKEYFGHTFTDKEIESIQKIGTPGNVVMAKFRQEEGEVPVLLKLDKETNHFFATRLQHVKIPDTFFDATLTDEQKELLKNGQTVKVENMLSKKTGKPFYANVQYSAEKKGLELIFEEGQKQEFPPKKIANKELTTEQQKDLIDGKTIYFANLRDKQGKEYNAYIRKNPESGKLKFFSKNPEDQAVQKIPANEHQTQVAANNDGHKPEALKNIKGPVEQKQPNTPTTQQTTKIKQEKAEKVAPAKKSKKNKIG